jgi:phage tail-like protein
MKRRVHPKEAKMAVPRDKPYPAVNFVVDLGSGQAEGREAGLAEVVFPEARLTIHEYRNGNEKTSEPHKIQTLTHYGNLLLRRGTLGSLSWYQWWDEARNGSQAVTRTILVRLLSEDHGAIVLSWKFLRARPVNHQFAPLNALANEPLMETLEIAFERLEME